MSLVGGTQCRGLVLEENEATLQTARSESDTEVTRKFSELTSTYVRARVKVCQQKRKQLLLAAASARLPALGLSAGRRDAIANQPERANDSNGRRRYYR